MQKYLDKKQPLIGPDCHVFDKFGHCPFGLTCRFNSKHIRKLDDSTYENVTDADKFKPDVCQIYNVVNSELRNKLWKRSYDYSVSDRIVQIVGEYVNGHNEGALKYNRNKGVIQKKNNQVEDDNADEPAKPAEPAETKTKKLGNVTDEDLIKLRTGEKKKIDWKNKLYLAPLTTVNMKR